MVFKEIKDCIDLACTITQTLLSLAACFLAWYIPEKIKWEQLYSSLIADYRSFSFGVAIQSVIEFFHDDCKCEVSLISEKYEERFMEDFAKLNERGGKIPHEQVLHFQRRMLSQYFYQLDLCARCWLIGKRRIDKDFTKGEAHITKVLYYMNLAVDESPVLFKDISCYDRVPQPEHVKGQNKYVADMYHIFKNLPRHMK